MSIIFKKMSTTIKLFIFFVFIIKIVNCGNCCSAPEVIEDEDDNNNVGGNVVVNNPVVEEVQDNQENVGEDNQHLVNLVEFAHEGHFDQENEGASSDVDFTTNENTTSTD
uniref:Uncharacterized protein n=2 Tax=Meloidogyne enterolobii TaxID=390850 RepID=A0A6V7X0E6_MELEN|nr:unnamed protein product [Meloidogyne enterolobii]